MAHGLPVRGASKGRAAQGRGRQAARLDLPRAPAEGH